MIPDATVFIVDDEAAIRDSLCWLLESVHLNVEAYASAEDFLHHYSPRRVGCLLLDVRMPGMSGLQLQQKLKQQKHALPIIIITGHGDVPIAVQAMKNQAFDFIEKPFHDQKLLDTIQAALSVDALSQKKRLEYEVIEARVNNLTPREREVMMLVLDNHSNKSIAKKLRLSVKTVEAHRARLMEKMYADSLLHLVKITNELAL